MSGFTIIQSTPGLKADYYRLSQQATRLSDIDFGAAPDASGTVADLSTINSSDPFWTDGPTDQFAARYTGNLKINAAGTYTLYLTSDDGSELYLDGQKVIDNDGLHGLATVPVQINLSAGNHQLEIRYFEDTGSQSLQLEFAGPETGGQRTILSGSNLSHFPVDSGPNDPPQEDPPAPQPEDPPAETPPSNPPAEDPPTDDGGTPPSEPEDPGVPDAGPQTPAPEGTMPAHGNANPTVSFNLTGISDSSPQDPFIDIMKSSRPWIANAPGEWGTMSRDELKEGGFLDADGWVKQIPEGIAGIVTVWAWGPMAEQRLGVYVLNYEGEGTVSINAPGLKILSQEPGRIVFENVGIDNNMVLGFSDTDPNGTGNYVRNISIVKEENLALHEAGAVFNPEWLDIVSDARDFRFMDWMRTNNSTQTSWDDRPQMDTPTYMGGAPVELMVRLANEAGVDPWFTMPHMADDNYVRKFAEYVRDNLDPGLTARVEYSNEIWNWAFEQTHWLAGKAASEWGDTSGTAYLDYQIMRATQVGKIWEDVFDQKGGAPDLVNVLGVQTVNEWAANRLLSGVGWKEKHPENFVDPATVFDELGVTTYFGSNVVSNEATRLALIDAINDPQVDATTWLTDLLRDPAQTLSIPGVLQELQQMKAVADTYGVKLVGYEGGQHVHHSFAVAGLTSQQVDALNGFMTEYVRSPEMADLYKDLWDVWKQVADNPFMLFGDVGRPSKYGSWALLSDLNDSNPRADYLLDQMENATPWWDAQPNSAYLQGVTKSGTAADDVMLGTDEEDFLAGLSGNDQFRTGLGKDGINGGEGFDRIYLSGAPSDYSIRAEGNGHIVSGPDGEKFVVNVESFVFGNGPTLTLEQLIGGDSGSSGGTDGPVEVESQLPAEGAVQVLGKGGTIFEAGDNPVVGTQEEDSDTTGLIFHGIGRTSSTGKELTQQSGEFTKAFVALNRGERVEITDEDGSVHSVRPTYKALNENLDVKSGLPVGDSALDAALMFGDVVIDPSELRGTEFRDVFLGRWSADVFYGEGGNDWLAGRKGADKLFGGDGNDMLRGQKGNDIMEGGAGSDRFYFRKGDGDDRITDFSKDDVLQLRGYLEKDQDLAGSASLDDDGNLVVSNGTDNITFEGLTMDDLDWISMG